MSTTVQSSCCKTTGAVMSSVGKDVDILTKSVKIFINTFDIVLSAVSLAGEALPGLSSLRGDFNTAKGVVETTNVIGTAQKLSESGNARWSKIASLVMLVIANILSVIAFIDKYTTMFFTQAGAMLGKLPIIGLIINAFVFTASCLSMKNATDDLQVTGKTLEKHKDGNINRINWVEIENQGIENYIRGKIAYYEDDTNGKTQANPKRAAEKLKFYRDLQASTEDGKYETFKKYRQDRIAPTLERAEKKKTESNLTIAAEVFKIAAIIFGILSLALAPFVPLLAGTIAVIAIAGISLIGNCIAIGKSFYSNKEVTPFKLEMPKRPSFPQEIPLPVVDEIIPTEEIEPIIEVTGN